MATKKGFGGLAPRAGNKDSVRFEELVDMAKFPDKKWVQLRFIDKVTPLQIHQHWIKILGGKDKREITIPRFCLAFNPNDPENPKEIHCPYCDISSGKDGAQRISEFFLVNAIVRSLQEEEPRKKSPFTAEEKKTGFKDIRSKSWTPVRVVRLTSSLVTRIQELSETNIHKDKKTGERRAYDATDMRYGFDVNIKYKADGAGTDKYSCDKVEGGATPLTPEEKEYLVYDLSEELLDKAGRMSEAQAKQDFKRMEIVGDVPTDDDDDERPRKKSKSRALDDDDDDDDDDDVPVKKKKKAALDDDDDDVPVKKKKKAALDDDDDDVPVKKKKKKTPFDDDEDDEDDIPKSKKKAPAKSSKKVVDEDDDDDDEAPKSKKKAPVKSKKADFDDDEDEDEDEAPKSKKKAPAKASKPVSKVKKKVVDEEDEEDKPVRKKDSSKSSKSSKVKAKAKKKDFDDDDE